MFRVSCLFLVLAALGAIWFFWPFGKYDDMVQVDAPRPEADGRLFTKPLSKDADAPEAKPGQEEASQDEAAATPGGAAQQAQPPKSLLQPKRFYRVVVQDGGSIQADDTTITLAEIEVEGLTGKCEDSRGQAWPCGRFARTALTRLIRGRAVLCSVPATGEETNLTARCAVGGKDLSLWMVTHGWAKPKAPASTVLTEAAETAQERRLGIWR
ncbi:MAG: thermonuclease family protein [Methyloceanibacter sp.]|jgi:hypothetical protein|uniref:thermonuclease family protein n=1 Tax=Methyloceanibacter sp. TaxID=1965321 RepID=UPI003C39CD02